MAAEGVESSTGGDAGAASMLDRDQLLEKHPKELKQMLKVRVRAKV